jgi:methylmalonyl-CoA mutase N-terminal domain/subunit
MGGMIAAIQLGFPQVEIARASYEYQQKVEKAEAVVVDVNRYRQQAEEPIEILRIDQSAEARQIEKLRQLRKKRNNEDVERTLNVLRHAADANSQNLMPPLLDAVRSCATLGEICDALREVFGTWQERPNI